MQQKFLMAVGVIATLFSCKSGDSRFPGYDKTETGAFFKMEKAGDGKTALNTGDVIFIHHVMTTDKDSVLYDYKTMSRPGQGPYAMRLAPSVYKGDMFEMMYKLHVGDSASFAMRVDSMFEKYYKQPIPPFLNKEGFIVYHVMVDSLYTSAKVDEIEKKNRAMQEAYIEKAKNSEDSLINKYLADNKITVKPTESGLYLDVKTKGKGPKIKKGDVVEVNYKGMFMDGRIFDASDRHDQAFFVPAGMQQVIPAWDEALLSMSVGEKVLLVCPSKIAYGPNGYNGIPPYAPLVFEMEIVGIKSDKK